MNIVNQKKSLRNILSISVCTALLATALMPNNLYAASNDKASNLDNPWLIRVRAINVNPVVDSTTTIGGSITADATFTPELDISYFFNKNFAVELVLATSKHDMGAINTAIGNVDLGDVWILPPMLTAQYHFAPDSKYRPYIGAGINYTMFYNESSGDVASIDYEDGFGYDFQVGMDIEVDDKWAINLDIKKLFIGTDVKLNGGAITADVDLTPWILGVGVAYKF